MFVRSGARAQLMTGEREKFLTEQWPQVLATIRRLGLDARELLMRTDAPQKGMGDERA